MNNDGSAVSDRRGIAEDNAGVNVAGQGNRSLIDNGNAGVDVAGQGNRSLIDNRNAGVNVAGQGNRSLCQDSVASFGRSGQGDDSESSEWRGRATTWDLRIGIERRPRIREQSAFQPLIGRTAQAAVGHDVRRASSPPGRRLKLFTYFGRWILVALVKAGVEGVIEWNGFAIVGHEVPND